MVLDDLWISRKAPRVPSILIVEDEPDLREAVAEALAQAGYSFLSVANLAEARCALASASYDVLLLDIFLDGVTCEELLTELAADHHAPATVLTSADVTPRSHHLARRFALPLVLKPFDLDDLVATIEQARQQSLV